jgi:hypothetical protein
MRQKYRIRNADLPEKWVFDEDGNVGLIMMMTDGEDPSSNCRSSFCILFSFQAHRAWELGKLNDFLKNDPETRKAVYISKLRENLESEDVVDKQTQKDKLKEKRFKRKFQENEMKEQELEVSVRYREDGCDFVKLDYDAEFSSHLVQKL